MLPPHALLRVSAGWRRLDRGELGADIARLPSTQFDVQSEGLLPVAGGLAGVFRGLVTVAEALMSVRLLVFVTLRLGQLEGGSVLRTGLTGLAGGEEKPTETVKRLGLPGCVTDFAEKCPGAAEMIVGLPVVSASQLGDAEVA